MAIGLVAAGALGEEDADRILADLEATLLSSGWLQVARMSASTSATGSAGAVARRVGTERPEWRRAIEDPPIPALRDVVPLVGRTITVGELTGHMLSLEVWSTCLVVNVARIDVDSHHLRERLGSTVRWRGWDDVGTQYQGGLAGGSGSHAMFVERRVFVPGPPDEARVLTLAIDHPGGQLTFSIPMGPARS